MVTNELAEQKEIAREIGRQRKKERERERERDGERREREKDSMNNLMCKKGIELDKMNGEAHHNSVARESLANFPHKGDKMLRVTVGNIQAKVVDLRYCSNNRLQLLQVTVTHTTAYCHILRKLYKMKKEKKHHQDMLMQLPCWLHFAWPSLRTVLMFS